VRSDLPGTVASAIERATRPSLVFDLARIEANLRKIASAARAHGITALFAAKSFPHPAVRALAATWLDGFDAASEGELAELPRARVISVVDPTGRAGARAIAERVTAERVIVGCETIDQVRAAPARAEIAIRLSASITGRDPAIGAVQDGTGDRRSRFGLDVPTLPDAIAELARAADGRRVGLHVHHGAVAATSGERFVATARAALEAAHAAGVEPSFLDVGGAWHAVADLPAALALLRAEVPAGIELVIEPGRAVAAEAGFACGRIVATRELGDRRAARSRGAPAPCDHALHVTDLSRICHLRWSPVELAGTPPRPGCGVPVLIAGPTCFEDDVLGEWLVEPETMTIGARIVVRHVTGYAVAWNTGFGGVPAADVVLV
jgi:2-[(L-alanin-3-ylcarbamoyl)methyl]-2-hydroxybutanedioate decarboxylase